MTFAAIHSFGSYVPSTMVSTRDIERKIKDTNPDIRMAGGIIEALTAISRVPVLAADQQASDLAVKAAEKSIAVSSISKSDIDLLLFASASQDVAEPATANIVQRKLGLRCPVFDIKNACNSFLNGIEVAVAFVESGKYRNVIVVTGEAPSRVRPYTFSSRDDLKHSFPALTLGDAGGAVMVSASRKSSVLYSKLQSYGEHWDLAAFLGGGSMYPNDVTKMRIAGDGTRLKQAFLDLGDSHVQAAVVGAGLSKVTDLAGVFMHQVAGAFNSETLDMLSIPPDMVYKTIDKYGNLASASLPVAIAQALEEGFVSRGDIVLVMGFASGINLALFVIEL